MTQCVASLHVLARRIISILPLHRAYDLEVWQCRPESLEVKEWSIDYISLTIHRAMNNFFPVIIFNDDKFYLVMWCRVKVDGAIRAKGWQHCRQTESRTSPRKGSSYTVVSCTNYHSIICFVFYWYWECNQIIWQISRGLLFSGSVILHTDIVGGTQVAKISIKLCVGFAVASRRQVLEQIF